jgi:endoglucanase
MVKPLFRSRRGRSLLTPWMARSAWRAGWTLQLRRWTLMALVMALVMGGLTACRTAWFNPRPVSTVVAVPTASSAADAKLLQDSWQAYRQKFIQTDGRVIDWEADQKSTSEGQAYALLRAFWSNDPETFTRVLNWAETNLIRQNLANPGGNTPKKRLDSLWAWKWGRNSAGIWGILDINFASDADVDTSLALILAAQRWNHPEYLDLARRKLQDLWDYSTLEVAQQRYLLPGPALAFRQRDVAILNPSYLAPYAFRLFAQADRRHDWLALVNSSYDLLSRSAALSVVGLPSDWVGLDIKTGEYAAVNAPLPSQYGFDASRVWWRVALDGSLYQEPRAIAYLTTHLAHLRQLWQAKAKLPAQIDLQGNPLVEYDSTSQYGMLYAAFQLVDPPIAAQIYQQKLLPRYHNGFWDGDAAYYTQNLVWFGLFPPRAIAPDFQAPA